MLLFPYCLCSKGEKAYCRKFEKLFSKRNSNDGDAPENSGKKRGKRNFPTENDYPENIEKCVSKTYRFMDNFLFERKGAKPCNFKTLDSGRKPDYRYAKENSREDPFEPKGKSAENEPKNVT